MCEGPDPLQQGLVQTLCDAIQLRGVMGGKFCTVPAFASVIEGLLRYSPPRSDRKTLTPCSGAG